MSEAERPRHELKRGLYALADADACRLRGLTVLDSAVAMVEAGVSAVQLRAKEWGASDTCRVAEQIKSRIPDQGPLLIVNDRADVAAAVGAWGVHVGQLDAEPQKLAQHFGGLAVGLSTHNREQFDAALEEASLAYIALGPVFSTLSKRNAEPPVGLSLLAQAHERARTRGVPLVAIGGITDAQLLRVATHCDVVAAISLLLPDPGSSEPYTRIRKSCEALHRLIQQTEPSRSVDLEDGER